MSRLPDHDDGALLSGFRKTRDEAAFTELVQRHLPLVFHVARRRLGSAALAEEATQNTFARLAAKAASVARHPERLRAWLHRTAWFEAGNLARKEARLSRLPVAIEPEYEPMNRPEIYDRLDEALGALPELDRELILRHCCGGEDYRRMAAAVGKSEAACQKRVERSLARLARTLGGARTTSTALAVLAAANSKSHGMPAAERIAAIALQQYAAAGGAVGAISGMKAACAALALAGGVAGWKTSPPPEPLLSAAPVTIPARPNRPQIVVKAAEEALAPRPARADRPLDEVLETIQAGRLAPLIEFLPQAAVTDLRAIMAEDDLGDLSEGMGTFGAAHGLTALRWVELDPGGAFEYGVSRSTNLAARMLAKWMHDDPGAAASAYLALPSLDRREIAGRMVQADDDIAGQLAAIDPDTAWVVEEQRIFHPERKIRAEDAETIVAGLLSGNRWDEPAGGEIRGILNAFQHLAREDHADAIARAERIPWPELRARVLVSLYQNHPPASASLAPGPLRTRAAAREAAQLMETDPEAAIRRLLAAAPGAGRNAILDPVSAGLAGSDPWRLLEIVASLDGGLEGSGSIESVQRAFEFAGRDDPKRALALLPEIAARLIGYDGVQGYAKRLLNGWLRKDAAGAIRWASQVGIWLNTNDLGETTESPQPLLDLLTDENDQVRRMAQHALSHRVADGLTDGSARQLLDRMPQEAADDLLKWLAGDACRFGRHDEAMRIAAMASPAARRERILPWMAFSALRNDHAEGLAWLKSLSAEDRRAVASGMEGIPGGAQYADEVGLPQALQQLEQ